MSPLLDDLRSAWRALLRSPGYVTVVVISLALGLGGAMAAFSILDAVRLRALPFPDGERLVTLSEVPRGNTAPTPTCGARCDVSYTTFANVVRHHRFRTADVVIGFTSGGKVYMAGGEPLPVTGGVLTPEAFGVLRVSPALGRVLLPSDDRLGVPLVTVLSHDFWTNQLGADSGIVGRVIKLSDSQYTVVGVMPAGFDFENGSKFWLPAVPTLDPSTRPSIRSLSVIARLAPGHTLADLRAELSSLEVPDQHAAAGPIAMQVAAAPLRERYVEATGSYDVMFAAMVGCLLALAVANLANLSLVRAIDQRRDATVRAALGASRGRLARQLVLQHLLLVVLATMVGLLVASWMLDVLGSVDVLNAQRPSGMAPRLDAHTVVFATVSALVVGALLAIAPVRVALQAAGDGALRGSAGSTIRRSRAQQLLLVVQVAGAFALLAAGVMLTRSARALGAVDVGFDTNHTLQATPSFPHPWRVPATYVPVTERILADLAAIPGVRHAAVRTVAPLPGASVVLDGGTAPLDVAQAPRAWVGVSDDYFRVLDVALVRGRVFGATDVAGGAPVAVVNAWAARRWWPGGDPVGRSLRVDTAPGAGVMLTVVGVVADNRAAQGAVLRAEPGPEVYRPWRQAPTAFPSFVASTAGDPAALLRPVRDLMVRSVPDRPVSATRTLDGIEAQVRGLRTNATQAVWLAVVGLMIAWLGIHGVTSYSVRRRTREIGIRGALGASPGAITRLLVGDVAQVAVVGMGIGIPLSVAAGRVMDSLLFAVHGSEAGVLGIAASVVGGAAALAALLPTWRARRIPAIEACRADDTF